MRTTRFCMILCTMLVALAAFAWAQGRKPGLWEITTIMTWQQSPFPAGTTPPGGANSPFGGGPHTTQVCLTQAIIDKYGAPMPQTRGDCQITNVQKGEHSMTADMVCSGRMSGKASIESSWEDPEHAKGKVHFTGSMQAGPNPKTIEWTTESTSVYKGADCGDVKPVPIPPDK
jgi:hypothetical protein